MKKPDPISQKATLGWQPAPDDILYRSLLAMR